MVQNIRKVSSKWVLTVGFLLAICVVWQASQWTYTEELKSLATTGEERLSLYAGTLRGAISQYSYLPYVLARNDSVKGMLDTGGTAEEVNNYLEELNDISGSAALFIMDASGLTLASSNWRDVQSFIGKNYSFRPYFTDAKRGLQGKFFAIGSTTGLPGFFMSQPVYEEDRFTGVVVVKIDLDSLQEEWRVGGETVMVSDANGVLFLSSRNDWKYKALKVLSSEQRESIRTGRQYGENPLEPVSLHSVERLNDNLQIVRSNKQSFLMLSRPLPILGWELLHLAPLASVRERTQAVAIIGAVLSMLFLALGMYMRERHQKQLSRRKAREAEAIQQVNLRLKEEIEEHRRTELALRDAQGELIQGSKLAALGQMAAGIVHELNQPISAMRTYAASGRLLFERKELGKVRDTFASITRLTDHMASITSQLKIFAYKAPLKTEQVLLQDCLDGALKMTEPLLAESSIIVEKRLSPEPVTIYADRSRIEQVLINLIRNAVDSMHETPRRILIIELAIDGKMTKLVVSDNGSGIEEEHLDELFDPFYTTKEVGKGLGLGLSITYRIITDIGGTIRATNNPNGGASFVVQLPMIQKDQTGEKV